MRPPLALVLAMITVAPGSAGAQSGFSWAVGGGAARNRVDCETCAEIKHYWGVSGFVRAGGGISDHVAISGELHFWQADVEGNDAYLRGIQGLVQWYPSSSGGFFGQVGLGLSRIRNSFDVGGETVRGAETGLNVSAGVGWDAAFARTRSRSGSGSMPRACWAMSRALRPYSRAVRVPICQGPSISLPRHQYFTLCGCS